MNTAFVLTLLASATALSPREEMVERVNNAGTTWTAAVDPKSAAMPLGSGKRGYGVKRSSAQVLEELIAKNGLQQGVRLVPKISADIAATIPDSFDAAENWPECAQVIGDIRDQSNCGCCWAFAAASAASDRACIASGGELLLPFSAGDVCFNAESDGCNGGDLYTPWSFIKDYGVVTGGQYLNDTASTPSDPFSGKGFCSSFAFPHCHHHGPVGNDPYPSEGEAGCPSESSPMPGPSTCDDSSEAPHDSFAADKYSFDGEVDLFYSSDAATLQYAIMTDGPIEVAFTVYEDFENYAEGIYQHVTGNSLGGHAVRMVGWGVDNGTDYWKVANSWNPYWGENGYFRILRGVDECGIESDAAASSSGATWAKMSALADHKRHMKTSGQISKQQGDDGMCCEGECDGDLEKYYSIDKIHNLCGECCMLDSDYWKYKIFEWGLTKSNSSTPCPDLGYPTYDSTVTHGVGLTMTLDLYDPEEQGRE